MAIDQYNVSNWYIHFEEDILRQCPFSFDWLGNPTSHSYHVVIGWDTSRTGVTYNTLWLVEVYPTTYKCSFSTLWLVADATCVFFFFSRCDELKIPLVFRYPRCDWSKDLLVLCFSTFTYWFVENIYSFIMDHSMTEIGIKKPGRSFEAECIQPDVHMKERKLKNLTFTWRVLTFQSKNCLELVPKKKNHQFWQVWMALLI